MRWIRRLLFGQTDARADVAAQYAEREISELKNVLTSLGVEIESKATYLADDDQPH